MSHSQDIPAEPPTNARYTVLAFMCSLAFVLYLDRICISQTAPDIMRDLGLTKTQFGYVAAAFTLAYALFEVPIGWWGDKYGSRGVLARIVIGWSIFTALTGAAFGFVSLVAIRFLFGAGEAGAFPNTARILSRWFPTERRGMAQGLVNSISQVGGALAPVLTSELMQRIGWRWTFFVFSFPGIIWAASFYWWYRDDPQTHPATNDAERKLITAGTAAHTGSVHPPIPWRIVLNSPQIWLMGAVLMCTAFNSYFYFTWYPTYLQEGRLVSKLVSGRMASIVLTGGAIGCICGGFLIDYLVRTTGNRHLSRRMYSFTALILAAICLVAGRHNDSPLWASIWTAGSVMFTLSTLAAWWGAVTDLSGRHIGALFGLMNSLGGLGAITSQLFVGRYADYMKSHGHVGRAQWDSIFYVYAGILVLGAFGWLLVNSSQSVDRD
ncbi:MAG: sauU 2 [Planctomycetaceae bacterium]|nr:sauU 2 [Planctomycetaceae bacterium]